MSDVTQILSAIERGDTRDADQLLPLVYEELRLLAARKLSQEPAGQTLQATALVHETYLRLVGEEARSWDSRGHFFAAAAEAMRRILVENARRKQSAKHGGRLRRVDFNDPDGNPKSMDHVWGPQIDIENSPEDLLALDEAMEALAREDPTTAQVVKLRYFAGLSLAQVAKILDVSERTAARFWAYGRVWLLRALTGSGSPSPTRNDALGDPAHPDGRQTE
jgi:RNA polymerase sigma factor (TIGR02999 family)